MLLLNSLFMCVPWLLYRFFHKKIGDPAQYLFVIFWLLFEFLHHRWDLSWPWLSLGNGLANASWLIQWYDITGTIGGSAFVLAMSFLLWKFISHKKRNYLFYAAGLFLFVFASSWFNLIKYRMRIHPAAGSMNVVVLQPSFDPWHEKFSRDPRDLVEEMLEISSKGVDTSTDLLVWPETSLVGNVDASNPANDYLVNMLRSYQHLHPKLNILTGADMQSVYRNVSKRPTLTARKTKQPDIWWDAYNSALYLDKNGEISFYHKSRLVPGTEQMPFVDIIPAIDKLAVKLDENSISGSLGKSDSAISLGKEPMKIAPVICYESIYGNYISEFVNHGSKAIAIITNDAWWGNTAGYKQHLAYGALRAIEQRKWVIRSANTGISCFVNPEGEILKQTNWWEKTTIQQQITFDKNKTIYCRLGDTRILIIFCSISLVLGMILFVKNNRSLNSKH